LTASNGGRWQGATTKSYLWYFEEEQRRQRSSGPALAVAGLLQLGQLRFEYDFSKLGPKRSGDPTDPGPDYRDALRHQGAPYAANEALYDRTCRY